MKLFFSNNKFAELHLNDSLVAERFKKIYKHLQHVPLNFKFWDNVYYKINIPIEKNIENLIICAKKLSIDVEKDKCLSQEYLNYLHKIYEKNYDGNPDWLDFHEHIHMCEKNNNSIQNSIAIDYREKAGLLTKEIERNMLSNLQVKVKKGQLYTKWSELGKTPYSYYEDKEPNDIKRICELVKPWLLLRPKIYIALEDCDLIPQNNLQDFEIWWDTYSAEWCKHYNLEKYDLIDIFGASIIGFTDDCDRIDNLLKQNILPNRVSL
jgi:hypothetical protein